jgi:Heterokaryon incompatibility protein (HET)
MANETFMYKPLDVATNEIRLLCIECDSNSELLQASLVNSPLDDPQPYMALSYAWKETALFSDTDLLESPHIKLNGQKFQVGHNLMSALEYLRRLPLVMLWIDAICIDQSNIKERGEQVLRMESIYSKAQSVLVWLGREAQNSDEAVHLIETIAELNDRADAPAWIPKTLTDKTHSRAWLAVHHLLQRSWWTRVWVVQETALTTSIEMMVGEKRLSWKCMEKFVRTLSTAFHEFARLLFYQEQIEIDFNALNALTTLQRLRKRRQEGDLARLTMLDILAMTVHSRSSDDRDRIYGIIGLATDATVSKPDYTLSAKDIFIEFTKSWIQSSRKLDIILIDTQPRPAMQLPTWAPDWGSNSLGCIPVNNDWSHAAPQTDSVVAFSPRNNVLNCKGLYFDKVDGCGHDLWTARTDPLALAIPSCNVTNAYATQGETIKAIWSSVVADQARYALNVNEAPKEFGPIFAEQCREVDELLGPPPTDGIPQPFSEGLSEFEKWYQRNRDFIFAGKTLRSWVLEETWDPDVIRSKGDDAVAAKDAFDTTCKHIGWKRRLITTNKGFIGYAIREVRPGDKICVLFGCSAPVILRHVQDQHHLIGECYLHGVMKGEALEMVKEVTAINIT